MLAAGFRMIKGKMFLTASSPPVLCAVCGFPHIDFSYCLSLGPFRILPGKPAPIYGLFHHLTGNLRLVFYCASLF